MPHQMRRHAPGGLHDGLLRGGKDGGNLRNGVAQGGRTMRAWPRVTGCELARTEPAHLLGLSTP